MNPQSPGEPIEQDSPESDSQDQPVNQQQKYQLKLSDAEMKRLYTRVDFDYRNAIADHNQRIGRWAEYYKRWRSVPNVPVAGQENKSNYMVPLIKWVIMQLLAKEADSMFGEDAEVVAVPAAPVDTGRVKKVGRYMTWRVFSNMKLVRPLCRFVVRKLLFGRSFAYSPWIRQTRQVRGEEIVDYEGPGFTPLAPDDLILPAEDCETIHEFSYAIRRYYVRPDDLLAGVEDGIYNEAVTDNFERIVNIARNAAQRDVTAGGEEIKQVADDAENMVYQRPISAGENLMVLEWYGRWRMLKDPKGDATDYDLKNREARESELVVRTLPDLNIAIGAQDLGVLYEGLKDKRPFVEASVVDDGRYWAPGICELLYDAEQELSVNHNMATDAAEGAVFPAVFYRPAKGMEPKTFKLEPRMAVPVDNPQTDVHVVQFGANITIAQWKEQTILSYIERLIGLSDMQMGRQADRPNAPRTARQTVALLEEGNVRLSLHMKLLAEDMSVILSHFWELDYWFAPQGLFFRVTEEDADGLWDVKDGGSLMNHEDRNGRFDFRLKFANSVWSREARKQDTLQRYGLDLQNPLIMQNPRALWAITNEVHAALGDPGFASLIPQPGPGDLPVDPKEEWARIQRGEEVTVNPGDNDELHLMRHMKDLKAAEADPDADQEHVRALAVHYTMQMEQLQQKKVMQAIAEQAVAAIGKIAQSQQQLAGGPQQPMQPPPQMPWAGGAPPEGGGQQA